MHSMKRFTMDFLPCTKTCFCIGPCVVYSANSLFDSFKTSMTSPEILFLAKVYFQSNPSVKRSTDAACFKSHFAVNEDVCYRLWRQIVPIKKHGTKPKHPLWGLFKLKTYKTDSLLSSFVNCERTTYNKWTWIIICYIASLENVSLAL